MNKVVMLRSLICSFLCFLGSNVSAEIFSYVDDNGRKIYVDSHYKIPQRYRDHSDTKTIEVEQLTEREQQGRKLMRDLVDRQQELQRELRKLESTLAKMETVIELHGRQVIVPVEINWRGRKKTLNLLLDTGASMTVLHEGSITSLNTVSRDSSYAQVAGGGVIKTERVVFDRLSVGPYDFKNLSTAVIDNSDSSVFSGLLGMDILGSVRYEIDYGQQKIIWSPNEYKQMLLAAEKLKELQAEATKIMSAEEKSPQ